MWRSVKIQPAHVTLALRVQAKAVEQHALPSASAIPGGDALAKVMQQYVRTQQAELDKGRKKRTLSYDLQTRVKEVGLSGLPHVLDWGVKMVITKVMDSVHLIGYQLVLTRVAEECGGARTAYYYDLLLRQKLAKELENGAAFVHGFLLNLDQDIFGDAKAKVESGAKLAGRLSGKSGHSLQSSPPAKATKQQESLMLESPLMLRGHQFNVAGVVPVRARRDGPKRTANKGKIARIANTPSQTTRGVPNAGEAAHHHRRQWTGGAPRMVWSRPSAELIRWIFLSDSDASSCMSGDNATFSHSSWDQRVHSDIDAVRSAIDALLADVERVVLMTPLDHLKWALALPVCREISRPPEMLRRAVHRGRAFGQSWFGSVSPEDSCFRV